MKAKVLLTTHKALQTKYELFKGYDVIVDEMPDWLMMKCMIAKGGVSYSEQESLPRNLRNTSFGSKSIICDSFNNGFFKEIIREIKDSAERASIVHFNPDNHFNTITILSAWPVGCMIYKAVTGRGVLVSSPENRKARLDFNKLANITVCEDFKGSKTARKSSDWSNVVLQIVEAAKEPTIYIDFNNQKTKLPENAIQICWNKTGLNFLSKLDKVAIASAFFYKPTQRDCMRAFFGDKWQEVQQLEGGAKMLQSIYRSCIRNRFPIELVIGDSRTRDAVVAVLDTRYTELPEMICEEIVNED